ncbi:spore coat protein [Paenibacillus pinistramenti]|uniref:spore coat protein n=1 Tax=Paenibacillus pinistramenti TaxID=1768003 RepID=UPI001EEF9111|nr:spore coat protein [Paenibacillus pinistramenti]
MTNQLLTEKDLLGTTLADLRRSVREYATAATESSCPMVRQMFTQLTDSTLKLQGDMYQLMASNNMYSGVSKAGRQEVSKRLQSAQQTMAQDQQFVQQQMAGSMGAQMSSMQNQMSGAPTL